MRVLRLLAAALTLIGPVPAQEAQESVGGVPYERLESREATETRMLSLLLPGRARWGDWYSLAPFPFVGHGADDLKTAHAPESELAQMIDGGPGPDLARAYSAKDEVQASWKNRGAMIARPLYFNTFADADLNENASAYFYTTIAVEEDRALAINCGSDDGLRLWLNGNLLVDKDVPRGLDVTSENLILQLTAGVNHLFGKVSQGVGGWAFQLQDQQGLAADRAALLRYYLDRDFPPDRVREHYRVIPIPSPKNVVLEVGGIDFLDVGTPIVATRRGDLYRVENAYDEPPLQVRFELFAEGLHEPLGLGIRMENGVEAVYTVQRAELTRLVDEDGDGRADLYETFCDAWGVSGNYHEFAFGPEFDDDGNLWVTLNVGFCGSLGKAVVPYRGWALRIDSEGNATPVCDGLRSPNGIGRWTDGSMFYVDNQGDYVATNRLSHLAQGSWHGHPASLRWREDLTEPGALPPRQPASVWFPYQKMGRSAADIAWDETEGWFGPFQNQFFVGDQADAEIMRVDIERVEGHYQGACFPFIDGLQCGVNRIAFGADGSMFVGETDRGWSSLGEDSFGLERIVYTGEVPFEILTMRALADGFELEFTKDVDWSTLLDRTSYAFSSYTYEYHAAYGAPEEDRREPKVLACAPVNQRRVRLKLEEMRAGYVHELRANGIRSVDGEALLHEDAYYSLIRVPGQAPREEAPSEPKVLFLTHSAGFEHGVVKRSDPHVLSHAEQKLSEAARGRFRILASKDCSNLEPDKLRNFDAVVFYTTGALPVSREVAEGLIAWVEAGGAFIGVHCATDTFYECARYMDMIGGAFDGHPWHQEVTVTVEDASHPATDHLGDAFEITDEIYQFRDFSREGLNVLLSLEHGSVEIEKGKRADGDYAIAWSRYIGDGRLFYTALGHRPDVWEDPRFMEHLLDGIGWALSGRRGN
ncbi:MAG: hypothetical protein CMJ89_10035 [Planctomycetes bacterium]|nr:hypothetical protein [Planctomycetota bacterium]